MARATALRRESARWLILFTAAAQAVTGALLNSTIDDGFPDPRAGVSISYIPPEAWNKGGSCERCTARPSVTELYNGTWHDSTFNTVAGSNNFPNTPLSATVTFTGSAIYVFCAIAKTTRGPFGNSDMTFFIDNDQVGNFYRPAPGTPGYDYNVLVYKNESIPNGEHAFTLRNGRVDGIQSLVLLDRIVYTYDDGSGGSPPIGAIVGGTLGGVAFLCAIAVAVGYWWMKRKDKGRAAANGTGSEPKQTPTGAPQAPPSHLTPVPFTLTSPTNMNHQHHPTSPSAVTTWSGKSGPQGHSHYRGPSGYTSGSSSAGNPQAPGPGTENPPGYYDSGSSSAATHYRSSGKR